MDRQDLYRKIKKLGVEKEISNTFGDNYTSVTNANLKAFLDKYNAKLAKRTFSSNSKKVTTDKCTEALIKLISVLQSNKFITASDAEEIVKML